MIGKKSSFFGPILSLLVVLGLFSLNFAQEKGEVKDLIVSEWLLLGPLTSPLPALSSERVTGPHIDDLLKFESADVSVFHPEEGRVLFGVDGGRLEWKTVSAADGEVQLPATSGLPSIAYLGVYLDVKRWTEAVLSVSSAQAFRVFVDAAPVSTKVKVDKVEEGEPPTKEKKVSSDLKLEAGVHWLLIKTVFEPSSKEEWNVRAVLSVKEKFTNPMPEARLTPESRMSVSLLLDGPKVTGVSVSPDGELAAVSLARSLPPTDSSESWVELRRTMYRPGS